jgi:hypothetical protein
MTDKSLYCSIELVEFEQLRKEINNRTALSNQLILAELTTLGVGISFYDKLPDVLLGLAAISSFLWLLWLDHTVQVYKIASYIVKKLAKRLQGQYSGALGWEQYLRQLDRGGAGATRLLFGDNKENQKDIQYTTFPQTRSVGRYIMFLFGTTAPILIIIYLFVNVTKPFLILLQVILFKYNAPTVIDTLAILRCFGAGLVICLWVYAIYQYRYFSSTVIAIDRALQMND